MILVILLVVIVVAAWWLLGTHQTASLSTLESTGFHADIRFDDTVSPVVLDTRARKIAFLNVRATRVYDYEQVAAWDIREWERPGGNDRSEPRVDRELIFRMRDPAQAGIRLTGFDADTAKRWYQQLMHELPQARGAR